MVSINPKDVIVDALNDNPTGTHADIAERVLKALAAAGVEVMAPQDVEWGECPNGGPHQVSLSLCSGCLEYDPE